DSMAAYPLFGPSSGKPEGQGLQRQASRDHGARRAANAPRRRTRVAVAGVSQRLPWSPAAASRRRERLIQSIVVSPIPFEGIDRPSSRVDDAARHDILSHGGSDP